MLDNHAHPHEHHGIDDVPDYLLGYATLGAVILVFALLAVAVISFWMRI